VTLLTLLTGTLAILGAVAMWRILTGKDKGLQKKKT